MRAVMTGSIMTFVSSSEGEVLDRIIEAGELGYPDTLDEREDELARGMVFRGVLDSEDTDAGTNYRLRRFENNDERDEDGTRCPVTEKSTPYA